MTDTLVTPPAIENPATPGSVKPKIYSFICRKCANPFHTDNPRQKTCHGPKCTDQGKRLRKRERKYKRDYQENKKVILANRYYRREARKQMILELQIPCGECHEMFTLKQLEVHHRDGNPANNAPENRMWACLPCHAKVDRIRREQQIADDNDAIAREL